MVAGSISMPFTWTLTSWFSCCLRLALEDPEKSEDIAIEVEQLAGSFPQI
jgi:hypothetical protein